MRSRQIRFITNEYVDNFLSGLSEANKRRAKDILKEYQEKETKQDEDSIFRANAHVIFTMCELLGLKYDSRKGFVKIK